MSGDLALEELGSVFEVGGVGSPSSSSPTSEFSYGREPGRDRGCQDHIPMPLPPPSPGTSLGVLRTTNPHESLSIHDGLADSVKSRPCIT